MRGWPGAPARPRQPRLRALLAEGEYVALRFSCETGEVAGDDYAAAQGTVLAAIRATAQAEKLPADLMPPDPWPEAHPASRFAGWAAGMG